MFEKPPKFKTKKTQINQSIAGSLTRRSCPSSSRPSGSSPSTTSTRNPTPGGSREQENEEIKQVEFVLFLGCSFYFHPYLFFCVLPNMILLCSPVWYRFKCKKKQQKIFLLSKIHNVFFLFWLFSWPTSIRLNCTLIWRKCTISSEFQIKMAKPKEMLYKLEQDEELRIEESFQTEIFSLCDVAILLLKPYIFCCYLLSFI